MSRRIIITYEGGDPELLTALYRVATVVSDGRVSESRGRKQFCFYSKFADGTLVAAMDLRTDTSADTFRVWREEGATDE